MTQQQASKCPYGCTAKCLVCREGKRLYQQAHKAFSCLPRRTSVPPTLWEWRLLEEWDRASEAWLAHIGQATHDRME